MRGPPDNHVHTGWSWDTPTSSTMRKACERAVALGLPAIAFTEHLDFTVWLDEDRATRTAPRPPPRPAAADRRAGLRRRARGPRALSRAADLLRVETGEPHLFAASVGAHLRDSPVDRVLGSLHSLDLDGRLVGVSRVLWADPGATMRRYLGEIVQMIERVTSSRCSRTCDFPRRYWPGGHDKFVEKDFEEEYRAVFRALAASGRALEINTSSPLASADQVRWFFEEGGEAVSFGSDAHQPGGGRRSSTWRSTSSRPPASGPAGPVRLLAPLTTAALRRVLHR